MELCRRVRELQLPHYVYILFLTVKAERAEMIAGLEVGADDFLRKPIDQGELLARLRAGSRVLALERRLSEIARTDQLTGLLDAADASSTCWPRNGTGLSGCVCPCRA